MSRVRPDLVVVQGDTTSAMGRRLPRTITARLVALWRRATDRRYFQPFQRRVTVDSSALSQLCTLPDALRAYRLQQEGVPEGRIFVTATPLATLCCA